jgi:hypothetical protein
MAPPFTQSGQCPNQIERIAKLPSMFQMSQRLGTLPVAVKYLVPSLHVYRNHPMWQFSIMSLPALPRRLVSVSLSPHIAFGQVFQNLLLHIFSAWAPDGKARCQYLCPRRSSNFPVPFTQTGLRKLDQCQIQAHQPSAKPYVWGDTPLSARQL